MNSPHLRRVRRNVAARLDLADRENEAAIVRRMSRPELRGTRIHICFSVLNARHTGAVLRPGYVSRSLRHVGISLVPEKVTE